MNCDVPDCVICQWLCERMIHHMDTLKAAIMEMAADEPSLTLHLWVGGE